MKKREDPCKYIYVFSSLNWKEDFIFVFLLHNHHLIIINKRKERQKVNVQSGGTAKYAAKVNIEKGWRVKVYFNNKSNQITTSIMNIDVTL